MKMTNYQAREAMRVSVTNALETAKNADVHARARAVRAENIRRTAQALARKGN